jgi:hypothetical protein
MGFWDDPANWPSGNGWPARPGDTVEGTVTRMELQQSRYGRQQLVVELDGDRVKRWCNGRLWRCLGDARIEPGDRIRVTRGPDDPSGGGEKPGSTWIVERIPVPTAPPPTGGPARDTWTAAPPPAQPRTQGPSW